MKKESVELKKTIIEKQETEKYLGSARKHDILFWVLFLGLISLPIAATFLHLKIHNENYPWLIYITLFDVIVISLLYFSRKTIFYGFVLNTVFFAVGVIAHFSILGIKGISNVLLSVPDFSIGYALWREYK